MNIGLLALQGAVSEHKITMRELGIEVSDVKEPTDLDGLDGLIMPGGESTTLRKLLKNAKKKFLKLKRSHNETQLTTFIYIPVNWSPKEQDHITDLSFPLGVELCVNLTFFFDGFHSHHLAMHWYKSIRIGKVRVSSPDSNWKNFFSFTHFEVTAILLPPPNL